MLSNLNAVPDGDPNGVFSIYLFRSAILTARKLFRTDKAALQGKRYITTPSAAAAAPPLKGRGRSLGDGAEIRPPSAGCGRFTRAHGKAAANAEAKHKKYRTVAINC